jgi:EpsI family protein
MNPSNSTNSINPSNPKEPNNSMNSSNSSNSSNSTTPLRFIIAVMILCGCIFLVYLHILSPRVKSAKSFKEFPSDISGWIGTQVVHDEEVLKVLEADKIVYKSYHNGKGPSVILFIAYYDDLEKVDFSHSPVVCFTGQGWDIKSSNEKEIAINLPERALIKVNQIIQQKSDNTMIALFWYHSGNGAFSKRGVQKLSLFFNRLFGKKDNNAFIRLDVTVPSGGSIEEANAHLLSFVQAVYPELRRFLIEN